MEHGRTVAASGMMATKKETAGLVIAVICAAASGVGLAAFAAQGGVHPGAMVAMAVGGALLTGGLVTIVCYDPDRDSQGR